MNRSGFSMIELVVAAGLLLVAMSFVVQMTHRVDHLWSDTSEHRVAIHELSSQLDRLSLLAPDEVSRQLETLRVAPQIAMTLKDASLSGKMIADELGNRVVLRLNWARRHPGNPLEMSAWVANADEVP